MTQLKNGYDTNVGAVNADTARDLRQAYISHMMNQKNLGQQLAALGRSGGASETTLLGLYNQYGQNRGALEAARNQQLNQLALQLAEQQAAQQADYNRAKSESTADYTRQKNAYQQARAQAVADWDAQSQARLQSNQQNYYNSLSQQSRQQSSRSSGGSKKPPKNPPRTKRPPATRTWRCAGRRCGPPSTTASWRRWTSATAADKGGSPKGDPPFCAKNRNTDQAKRPAAGYNEAEGTKMDQWNRCMQPLIDEIDACIRDKQNETLTLRILSQKFGYSESHFSRNFRRVSGMRLRDYLRFRRLAFALAPLREGRQPIVQIALDAGFSSHEAFTRPSGGLRHHARPVPQPPPRWRCTPFCAPLTAGCWSRARRRTGENLSGHHPAHGFAYIQNRRASAIGTSGKGRTASPGRTRPPSAACWKSCRASWTIWAAARRRAAAGS